MYVVEDEENGPVFPPFLYSLSKSLKSKKQSIKNVVNGEGGGSNKVHIFWEGHKNMNRLKVKKSGKTIYGVIHSSKRLTKQNEYTIICFWDFLTFSRFKKVWRFRHILVAFSEYMNFIWWLTCFRADITSSALCCCCPPRTEWAVVIMGDFSTPPVLLPKFPRVDTRVFKLLLLPLLKCDKNMHMIIIVSSHIIVVFMP